jgi:arsenical pump membrane protein
VIVPAAFATLATGCGLLLIYRRLLRGSERTTAAVSELAGAPLLGCVVTIAVAVLTVVLRSAALLVLTVGVLGAVAQIVRGRLRVGEVIRAVGPLVLLGLFVAAVALGVLARSWDGPSQLLHAAGRGETALIGALTAVLVNNLPAAVLLSARPPTHPAALLVGLNLGPNLAMTGSLSALLWFRVARQVGAAPSVARYSRLGILLAPLGIGVALAAIGAFGTPS